MERIQLQRSRPLFNGQRRNEHKAQEMFAVIKTGGKQYKVAADDEITVMLLEGDVGASVTFGEVLSFGEGASIEIGTPFVAGATVEGEIVKQKRGPKVIAFKKRRRKNSRRKRGHRQDLTVVRITDILAAGQERRKKSGDIADAAADVPAAPVADIEAPAVTEAPVPPVADIEPAEAGVA